MPERIHFDQWELGIDLRKDESISDANRLVECLNAYITSGWAIKPRPGVTNVGTLTAGTVGLTSFNGKLHTFSNDVVTHSDLDDGVKVVDHETAFVSTAALDDDFSSNLGWTLGPGCTIAAGVMDWDGSQTAASESFFNVHAKDGAYYLIRATVSGRTAGDLGVWLGDTEVYEFTAENTTKQEIGIMSGNTGRIRLIATADFDGNVDDLRVLEVGTPLFFDRFNNNDAGWTLGTGWDISGSRMNSDGTQSGTSDASIDLDLENGTAYTVTWSMETRSAGSVQLLLGSATGSTLSAVTIGQEDTVTMNDASGTLTLRASADFVGGLDDVVVRKADTDELLVSISADVFNGALYVAAKYENNAVKHHYLSGSPDATNNFIITDVNCPHSESFLVTASKIWAPDYDVVRFSATDDPTDWTTSSDAGFLPTGTRSPGSEEVVGLGDFQSQLVVFHIDNIQLWNVDPDPQQHAIDRIIGNVGSKFPRTIIPVAGDLYFLTDVGVRSIAYQKYTENVEDVDIGVPIDDLVRPEIAALAASDPVAVFYPGGGQYWIIIDDYVYVYSFSRTSKVAAWTRYTLPVTPEYFASIGNNLYFRSGDEIYKIDPSATDDDGTPFDGLIDMAFQSFQAPGVNKKVLAFDVVVEGTVTVSHRFNPNNPTVFTAEIDVSGDTRPLGMYPVGVITTDIAPRIAFSSDTFQRLNAVSYLYERVGGL